MKVGDYRGDYIGYIAFFGWFLKALCLVLTVRG